MKYTAIFRDEKLQDPKTFRLLFVLFLYMHRWYKIWINLQYLWNGYWIIDNSRKVTISKIISSTTLNFSSSHIFGSISRQFDGPVRVCCSFLCRERKHATRNIYYKSRRRRRQRFIKPSWPKKKPYCKSNISNMHRVYGA